MGSGNQRKQALRIMVEIAAAAFLLVSISAADELLIQNSVSDASALPDIIITSPTDGLKTNISGITVSGTASGDNLSTVKVRVGTGEWQTADGTSIWNASVTLLEGTN